MMVFRAFLSQNVGVGCAFGGFGVSVLPLQEAYGASSGSATLALALCVLVLGLSSPFVGSMIGRIGLRWTMLTGTVISGIGYISLAFAPSMPIVLLLYALPLGVGLAMFGPFPSSVLASNWYPHNPGPALGVANTPLFAAVLPLVGVVLIRDHGLPTFYLVMAGLHLLLLPVLLGVSDGPSDRTDLSADAHGHVVRPMIATGSLLRSPLFWGLCLGGGFLSAAGIAGVSHLAPYAAERGVAPTQAAALLSIMGGAAVIGSLVVGLLCSKLGASRTLSLIAAALGFSWAILLSTLAFLPMSLATLILGACGAGVFPAINTLSGRLFGQDSLPRVIGLYAIVSLPLTFCLSPLAGVMRDAVGHYGPVVAAIIGGCVGVTVLFYVMAVSSQNGRYLSQ